MALETLKGVEWIDGFKVMQERPRKENGEVDWNLFDEMRKNQPIYVDHDVNMISFGFALMNFAMISLLSSRIFVAASPVPCKLEGFPNCSLKKGSIFETTLGSTGFAL